MTISVFQAVLLGIFACLGSFIPLAGYPVGNYTIGRPLVGGLIVGIILGDVTTGVIVGAAIQVVYIALVTPGGAVAADMRAVNFIGIPLAMLAIHSQGLDPNSPAAASLAVALGAAVGTIGTVLVYATSTLNLVWQSIGWKVIEQGRWERIRKMIPLVNVAFPALTHIVFSFVPTVAICLVGTSLVDAMKIYLPMDGLAMKTLFTVGSLLPAVGVAILCKQIMTRALDWITFAFGFTLAAVMGCNLIAAALIACFFALVNFEIQNVRNARLATAPAAGEDDEEEEEDI